MVDRFEDMLIEESKYRNSLKDNESDIKLNNQIKKSNNKYKKWLSLVIVSVCQYIDVFSTYSTIIAIPVIGKDVGLESSTQTWIIDGYLLVFASFLLFFGKTSDIYSPKLVFVIGLFWLGLMHLIAGFMSNAIALIIIKAISGLGAAATIPSAIKIIVAEFENKSTRETALAIFCACGGIANVTGTIIGGLLTSAGWRWVFWIVAIVTIPLSILAQFNIPKFPMKLNNETKLEPISVLVIVSSLVLLIFSLTTGNTAVGWKSAQVIAPLVISVFLFTIFFIIQRRFPVNKSLIPPHIWRYKGFTPLFIVAVTVSAWWTCVLISIARVYQDFYSYDPTKAAVHFIPLGIASLICGLLASLIFKYCNFKLCILIAFLSSTAGAVLLSFTDSKDLYWRLAVPGMIIGSAGCAFNYASTNVGMVQISPQEESGLAGSLFQMAQQMGSSVIISIHVAIRGAVESKTAENDYTGTAAGLWFLAGLHGLAFSLILVFYPNKTI